jgi:hypothetical protein
VQAPDAVANRLEHALHLPVTPFVDRQLDTRTVDPTHARRAGWAVVELDAMS